MSWSPLSPSSGNRSAVEQRAELVRLALDLVSLDEMVEPSDRDRRRAVERAEQGSGHGGVRVGVAAEANDAWGALLKAERLARHLQCDPGGEEREPLVWAVDLARPAGLADHELELLATLAVRQDREDVQNGGIRRCPSNQPGDGQRHRKACRLTAPIPGGEAAQRRRLVEEPIRLVHPDDAEGRAVHDGPVPRADLRPSP